MTIQQLDEGLWVASAPLRFLGLGLGTRMTVVRLPDSHLWLHSTIEAKPELVDQVRALGEVRYLVAPNRLHHLFVGQWKEAFPEALVYAAPGLAEKRSDLEIAGQLDREGEAPWSEQVEQQFIDGFPFANEVVFFHRPSRTLIVSDLAFNVGPSSPPLTRLAFRSMGAYGRLAVTPLERVLIRDKKAFRPCLEKVLEWPFDRVIVAHGEVQETGGRAALRAAYAWLLGRSA